MTKCLFPIYAYVVWCAQRSKNLERYLLYIVVALLSTIHSGKNNVRNPFFVLIHDKCRDFRAHLNSCQLPCHSYLLLYNYHLSSLQGRRHEEDRQDCSLKVEKNLKGSLDSIPSPLTSVNIQIMGGKVCLRCIGKTLLGVVNKLLKTKSLLTSRNSVLPYYLK